MDLYAFEEAIKAHLKRAGLSQAAVARKLHYTPEQLNKWIRGVNRIPDTAIQEIAELLDLTEEERIELFTLAGYVAFAPVRGNPVSGSFSRSFFIGALRDWNDSFFRWSKASPHLRSSWAGLVIHAMSAVTDRITARGLLIVCLSLLLGIATAYLMKPVLQWPLDEAGVRGQACLKFGLATLVIPLFVTMVTPPDSTGLFKLETPRQHLIFGLLKLTGALVGFWVFAIGVIGVALVWYYLFLSPLPGAIQIGLALIPLFLSYVSARRIPADRYKMFKSQLQMHPADRLFLITFTFLGPLLALFLYFFHWFLSDRSIAPVTLLIILATIALWEYRKQHQFIPDSLLILIYGLFIPGLILFYAFFLYPGLPPPSASEIPSLILGLIYFLGWTLFLVTLLVRNRPILTLSASFSLLALAILANLLVTVERWLGFGFMLIVACSWALWGRRRLRPYFWVHESFWGMLGASGLGLYLLATALIPGWVAGLSFIIVTAGLIGWAYRAGETMRP